MKTCPFCAEEIQDAAIVCRFCGRDLPTQESEDVAEESQNSNDLEMAETSTSPEKEKKWLKNKKVIFIAVAIIVALCLLCIVASMIWAKTPGGKQALTNQASTVTSNAIAQITEDAKPTKTIAPTNTPTVTKTPKPTNTPEPTATIDMAIYSSIDVRELDSYTENHIGEKIQLVGEIFNIVDDFFQINVQNPEKEYSNIPVIITYNNIVLPPGLYEGKKVAIYGTVIGKFEGTNLFGGTLSQPSVDADLIEIFDGVAQPSITEEPVLGDRNYPVPFNQEFIIELDNQKYSFKVSKADRGNEAWVKLFSASIYNDPAPEGQEYVLVFLDVTYLEGPNNEKLKLSSYQLNSVSNNQILDNPFVVEPDPDFNISLFPTGRATGYAALLTYIDDPNPILLFEADYSTEYYFELLPHEVE